MLRSAILEQQHHIWQIDTATAHHWPASGVDWKLHSSGNNNHIYHYSVTRVINCLFSIIFSEIYSARCIWTIWQPLWWNDSIRGGAWPLMTPRWQWPRFAVNFIGHHPSQFTAGSWQSWIFSDIWPHSIRPSDICASFVSFSFISESSVECGASSSVVRATAAASARASRRRHLLNTARRRGVGWRSQQTARPAEWETRPTPATRSKAMAQRQDLEARACRQKHARACSNY